MTFASQCKNSHGFQEAKTRPNSKWKQAKCLNCCNYVHNGDFQQVIVFCHGLLSGDELLGPALVHKVVCSR